MNQIRSCNDTHAASIPHEGLDLFCRHEAGVLIASHRRLYETALSSERGEGPSFVTFAMSGYTDMVQLVSVIANEDTARQTAGQEFAAALLRRA